MDLISAYGIINKSIKNVADSTVRLSVLEVPEKETQLRLKDASFNVATRANRVAPAITAHNLGQYKNRFYSIRLKDTNSCPLDILMNMEFDESKLQVFRRSYGS